MDENNNLLLIQTADDKYFKARIYFDILYIFLSLTTTTTKKNVPLYFH